MSSESSLIWGINLSARPNNQLDETIDIYGLKQ